MKRVAIFTPGGVGPSNKRIHIPPLTKLVERLSSHHNITVFSLNAAGSRREMERCGHASVKYVEASYESTFPVKALSLSSAFIREHRRDKFDLLHGLWALPCGLLAVLLGKLYRVPSLVTLLGGETANLRRIQYGNYARPSTAAFTRWTCDHADQVVALTDFQAHQLIGLGIRQPHVRLVPIGADEMFLCEGRSRKPTPPYRLLHIGSMTEVKDQVTLLQAFAAISRRTDARLQIVGADYLGGKIQALVRELGVERLVTFTGQVDHHRLPDYYARADVLLHTSLHEAQSVVVAEAAASGVPVVGTRVGLIDDFGEDRALAVDPGDHEGLAGRVLEILEDAGKYDALQRNAQTWAAQHTLQWTVAAYARLYREIRR